MNFNARDEAVRGYLLLGVFYVHALWDSIYFVQHWWLAPLSFALAKILAPYISIFFLLSGMSARNLGKKSFRSMLPQSVMLIFVAWISEDIGIVLRNLLYGGYGYGLQFIKAACKPMLYGTGGCDYVTWFFTTLAVVRIFGWLFSRNKIYFALSLLAAYGLVILSQRFGLPDNLYEWRNWPVAILFFIIGMVLPKDLQVKRGIALVALAASLVLLWINAPDLWTRGPCLTCNVAFAAQPTLGDEGSFMVYVIGVALGLVFLLWVAQDPYPPLGRLGRFFGRPSLQFLLLHGWLLVSIEPLMAIAAPRRMNIVENLAFLLPFVVIIPLLHAFLYRHTARFLNAVLARCFDWARRMTDICYGWLGLDGPAAPRLLNQ